ncbi:MAG TPA: heat-inducible transcriptional repressor HrcA [Gemmatimonadales bacterium]|nr:heat-inducible transcriptional repressor HrcA [Gemmatimonadales bacterium]
MVPGDLSERERRVLEAVIQAYVETAEPAGSRTLSRRFELGVSPATIRNTMSDLEEKGYLFHPHTSAGRVPTDKAYRAYVNSLSSVQPIASPLRDKLAEELSAGGSAIESILRRAAQSLSVITQELGVAIGPQFDRSVLQQLELARLSSDRILVVLTLSGGAMRTIFVEARAEMADDSFAEVTQLLNERLAGLTVREIRTTLASRLRDTRPRSEHARELLNVFVQEGEQLFDVDRMPSESSIVLGQAAVLAEQPEFATGENMRRLLELTDTRHQLATVLQDRTDQQGMTITIGNEHSDPRLERFTVVTAEYRAGELAGVIGVIGPTRMPYEKIISIVHHTSRLLTELLD